jgi:putative GTP pyrophosphokinase
MNQSESDYHELVADLDQFGAILSSLLKELLSHAGIRVHSIDYRVKDYQSALRKLTLKQERYSSFSELTDLLGIRIITYFSDEVDEISKVITQEFNIDNDNSIDKRKALSTDQFGYLSLHYIASLADNRNELIEYKRFASKKFELQIRSILQHAWAEIEHDIGYKADGAVPDQFRRRFFRLAGLLELADEEFERLRDEASEYKKAVKVTIKKSPKTLAIDQDTIVAVLKSENALIELDQSIADIANSNLQQKVDPDYAAARVGHLKSLGLSNVDQVIKYSTEYRAHVDEFARIWLKTMKTKPSKASTTMGRPFFNRGIGLFYLGYVLAAQKEMSELTNWGHGILGRNDGLIDSVKETFEEVVHNIGPLPKSK